MKTLAKASLFLTLLVLFSAFTADSKKTIYDFSAQDINGNKVKLSKYQGKVLLVVNVASKCGLTPQYADIQALYDKYSGQGLEVLAFPANNFMNQEPGTNQEINSFCTEKYGITFTIFGKISVGGKDIHPIYKYLTQKTENGVIDAPVKWNFQKFLIGRDGKVIDSFKPQERVTEEAIVKKIEKALGHP